MMADLVDDVVGPQVADFKHRRGVK
jgi:hypothetical protein